MLLWLVIDILSAVINLLGNSKLSQVLHISKSDGPVLKFHVARRLVIEIVKKWDLGRELGVNDNFDRFAVPRSSHSSLYS